MSGIGDLFKRAIFRREPVPEPAPEPVPAPTVPTAPALSRHNFGATVHDPEAPGVLDWLRRSGITHVRTTFRYGSYVDPRPFNDRGELDSAGFTERERFWRKIAIFRDRGIKVLVVAHGAPPDDQRGDGLPEQLREMLDDSWTHSPGTIEAVQIGNEMNPVNSQWLPRLGADRPLDIALDEIERGNLYAVLFSRCALALRSTGRPLKILSCGTVGDPRPFLTGFLSVVAPHFLDGIAVHGTGYPPAQQFVDHVRWARQIANGLGFASLPIYATEVASEGGRSSDETQLTDVDGVLHEYVNLGPSFAARLYWYAAEAGASGEGLIRADGIVRPAGDHYASFVSLLKAG